MPRPTATLLLGTLVLGAALLAAGAGLARGAEVIRPMPDPAAPAAPPAGARTARVVNGFDADPDAYPFVAGLIVRGPDGAGYRCGGTLIAPRWVLTAAHCVKPVDQGRVLPTTAPDSIEVYLGDYRFREGKLYHAARVIAHPGYWESYELYNDIALIELTEPSDVTPAALNNDGRFRAPGAPTRIVGWGTTAFEGEVSQALKDAPTHLVERNECEQANLRRKEMEVYGPIDDTRLCAGGNTSDGDPVDTCQGDSGGPLLSANAEGQWVATGVVSYGYRCAVPGYYGVYTNVAHFADWIATQTESLAFDDAPPPPPDAPPHAPTAVEQLLQIAGSGGVTILPRQGPRPPPGSLVEFEVESAVDGDLYVIDIGSSGDVRQIFPNERTEMFGVSPRIHAGRPMRLPNPRRHGFQLRVPGDSFKRWVVAIVTRDASPLLQQVTASRGLNPVNTPGQYLRDIVNAVNCDSAAAQCSAGYFRLDLSP